MAQDWSQHGRYRLDWQGDVLRVHYEGVWNEVAVRHLHRDIGSQWSAPGARRCWAMLGDLQQWEGTTPEAGELWWHFLEDAVAHGLVALCDLMPSHFHALMLRANAERAARLTRYRQVATPAEGLAWLGELGFASPAPAASPPPDSHSR